MRSTRQRWGGGERVERLSWGFGFMLLPSLPPSTLFFLVCAPGKPAALILVEQALQAGMEKVVLVVAPHAQAEFEMFFSWPVAPEVGMRA